MGYKKEHIRDLERQKIVLNDVLEFETKEEKKVLIENQIYEINHSIKILTGVKDVKCVKLET